MSKSTIILPPNQRQYSPDPNSSGVPTDVSAYATDLARWDNGHKHKFLFITEIEFHTYYLNIADKSKFALLAQTATRPKLKFEYAEYNDYGIKRAALVKTTFEPMEMTFIDDNANNVMQFFTNVHRLMSPITNIENADSTGSRQYDFKTGTGSLVNINVNRTTEIANGQHKPNVYAQSSGYPGAAHGSKAEPPPASIFKSIKLHHVHAQGAGVNTYTFKNPKLEAMAFDDLDMTSAGEVSLLKINFSYEYLTSHTGEMTSDISKLVGQVNYHLRRDLG